MSVATVVVKEERECDGVISPAAVWVTEEWACDYQMSPVAVRVKEERQCEDGLSPAVLVKDEREWDGASEAAAAGLDPGHDVKCELVLGPERTQPQDVAFALQQPLNKKKVTIELEPVKEEVTEVELPGKAPHGVKSCGEQYELELTPIDKELQSSQSASHQLTHTKSQPYTCKICDKQFTQDSTLTKHINQFHNGEKPYTCQICEKQFVYKSSLVQHKLIHKGETYECEICKKQFKSRFLLAQHKLSHSGGTSYECEICKKEFKYKTSLTKHEATAHAWGRNHTRV